MNNSKNFYNIHNSNENEKDTLQNLNDNLNFNSQIANAVQNDNTTNYCAGENALDEQKSKTFYIRTDLIDEFIKGVKFPKDEFFEVLNISKEDVEKLYNNDPLFPIEDLLKIARILEIPVDFLLNTKATKSLLSFNLEQLRRVKFYAYIDDNGGTFAIENGAHLAPQHIQINPNEIMLILAREQ